MISFLWLLMAMTYSTTSAIEAPLAMGQPTANPQQANVPPRPMAQSSAGQQPFLSQQQQAPSMAGAMPAAGMAAQETGAFPKPSLASQSTPLQDPYPAQELPAVGSYSPNAATGMMRNQSPAMNDAMAMTPPQSMTSPQTMTPAQMMMNPPQAMTPAQTTMNSPQATMNSPQAMMSPPQTTTSPPQTTTTPPQTKMPFDFSMFMPTPKNKQPTESQPMYSMKQASNATNSTPSALPASGMTPSPAEQMTNNSQALNTSMAETKYNKKKMNASSNSKNQTMPATKNQTLLATDNQTSIAAPNPPMPTAANQTQSAMTPPATKSKAKTPPPMEMAAGQQMNNTTEIPPAGAAAPPLTNQASPKAMKSAPLIATSSAAKLAGFSSSNTTSTPSVENFDSSATPDIAQLVATEKFNGDIQINAQDDLKAVELINQLRAASKLKLSNHQLGNQTIFLNSLTAEQKAILDSKIKSLTLTPTQLQLERNYLSTFVSDSDRMAHQAGFDAIKRFLTPEAQRGFDPSEGMKSLQLTENQKYLYEEGSREYLEDPGMRNQSGPSLQSSHSMVLFALLFSGLLMSNI
ncbi:hypothetical protein PGT21_010646 [Puccinia graminis f. sp. tritici]|uniref:Uncharacterized protein n=1 Tax=Puccinia graminis f. sp. tritici TaxID=56615 RepID=A0A5B0M351_PUCGR|nr:hypothetical protein PGT21_010646 [Puccinia graminis f. sp. tritici]KAA1090008.1 hypothetical protein PGTUg99_033634 [Puccinia graminis f. sp. tritici]